MKKLLLATAAAAPLLAASLASAADLGVRAAAPPAPVVPVYTWTGLYVGAGWGYGMYNLDTTASVLPPLFSVSQTLGGRGWLGTAVVGGDYQVNNWLVLGAFGDYDWANIKNNGANPVFGTMKEKSAWAVGGWFIGSGFDTRLSGLLSGWLGLGPGWYWRTEYRFSQFESATFTSVPAVATASVRPYTQTVRTEIIYKFNSY
jgi:outer membrane immunogenic protein